MFVLLREIRASLFTLLIIILMAAIGFASPRIIRC